MHRDLLPGIPFSFEHWEHCTLKLPAPTLLRRFHPSAPTVCDPHLLPTANTIPGELSATLPLLDYGRVARHPLRIRLLFSALPRWRTGRGLAGHKLVGHA